MSKVRIISRTNQYSSLVSPARDKNEPVYNWHAFKHSYSKKLVGELVEMFALKKGTWVLDPFAGGGTTLLACKEYGINARGFDILPFSVFLSNVKTRTYDPNALEKYLRHFRNTNITLDANADLPDIGIMNAAFSQKVRHELLKIRQQIESIKDQSIRDFYTLGLLSILESVSNTSKAGGFLRITKRKITPESVRQRFLDRVETMIRDVRLFNVAVKFPGTSTSTELSDSRTFSVGKKFDAIITSPPYPNRHDYTRIYGLELIFSFVNNNAELKKIRYNTLRSHVEARKQFTAQGYTQPKIVEKLVKRVEKAGPNNSKVTEMLGGYFEDMYLSLRQMQKSLKKGGKIALVVSNVRFCGVGIPVDSILAEIGEQAGLSAQTIFTARYRGNSAQQMETYKRKPTRESIVIWQKK